MKIIYVTIIQGLVTHWNVPSFSNKLSGKSKARAHWRGAPPIHVFIEHLTCSWWPHSIGVGLILSISYSLGCKLYPIPVIKMHTIDIIIDNFS